MTDEQYLDMVAAVQTLTPYVHRAQGMAWMDWTLVAPEDRFMINWAWGVLKALEPHRARAHRVPNPRAARVEPPDVLTQRNAAFDAWWAAPVGCDAQESAALDTAQLALGQMWGQAFEALWAQAVAHVQRNQAAWVGLLPRVAAEQRAADDAAEQAAARKVALLGVQAYVQPGVPVRQQVRHLAQVARKIAPALAVADAHWAAVDADAAYAAQQAAPVPGRRSLASVTPAPYQTVAIAPPAPAPVYDYETPEYQARMARMKPAQPKRAVPAPFVKRPRP